MSREQILAVLTVLAFLGTAIQEFIAVKTEVAEIKVHLEYLAGSNWHPPKEQR